MITKEELRELETWVKNTWTVEEKEQFYSLFFRLNNEGITPETEKDVQKLRDLIVKKYDEYTTNFVEDVMKLEEAIQRDSIEAKALEEKLSNKENYLINDQAVLIRSLNYDHDIEELNEKIHEYEQRKNELLSKKDNKEQKEAIAARLTEMEERLDKLRRELAIIRLDDERFGELREEYSNLMTEKSELANQKEDLEKLGVNNEIEEEIQRIDSNIDHYNRILKIFEERKRENEAALNGEKKYNQAAIKADEDRLHYLQSGIEAAENSIKNNGNTDYEAVFDKYIDQLGATKDPEIIDEEPIKVVKTTPWEWVKQHKKQILIALGLTALAISAVVVVTQLLPALMAAQQAAQTAGLAAQMVSNGSAWFGASVTEQAALHGANSVLASQVSAFTGMSSAFNVGSGVWTFGGQSLSALVQSTALSATKAQALVSTLTGTSLAAGLGGIGAVGAGLLLPKRSEEYKQINSQLKDLKARLYDMSDEEFEVAFEQVSNKIMNSKTLDEKEKKVLLKRLKSIIRKRSKYIEEPVVEAEMVEVVEPELVESIDQVEPIEGIVEQQPVLLPPHIEEAVLIDDGEEAYFEEAQPVKGL